jgi:hypothetical protein
MHNNHKGISIHGFKLDKNENLNFTYGNIFKEFA